MVKLMRMNVENVFRKITVAGLPVQWINRKENKDSSFDGEVVMSGAAIEDCSVVLDTQCVLSFSYPNTISRING